MSYIYSMVDLWNEGGTTFKGIQINVTNTSSAAASRVMDLQVGGVSQFQVAPNGQQFGTLGTALLPSISFIGDPNTGMYSPAADTIALSTAGAEAMRITSTGNVVLNPSSGYVSIGTFTVSDKLTINGGGIFIENDTNGPTDTWVRNINAGSSARSRVVFNASGNSWSMGMGSSANNGNALTWNVDVASANTERLRLATGGDLTPGADNTQNFGSGSLRWATIYAGTGTINTSDERYKVLREGGDLSDAEHRAWSAVRAIVYRDKDSFERKGDAARLHIGYSWQSIQAAFEAEGLDAARYGLWCEDALEAPVEKTRTATRPVEGHTETVLVMEEYQETYTEMEPTGETRGGLRYSQCSVIEAAWLRRELASLTARVSALEAI